MNGERLLVCIKQCIMQHFQPMIYDESRCVIETTRGTFSVPDNYKKYKESESYKRDLESFSKVEIEK